MYQSSRSFCGVNPGLPDPNCLGGSWAKFVFKRRNQYRNAGAVTVSKSLPQCCGNILSYFRGGGGLGKKKIMSWMVTLVFTTLFHCYIWFFATFNFCLKPTKYHYQVLVMYDNFESDKILRILDKKETWTAINFSSAKNIFFLLISQPNEGNISQEFQRKVIYWAEDDVIIVVMLSV